MAEVDRREFLKIIGVSAGAAAAAGCSEPVEKLIPYVIQPEEITPGIPVFYASSCRECAAGCGTHVRTREGRPIKIEGNPDHPINRGALCARGQASIGRTYHPDRYAGPLLRNEQGQLKDVSWDDAIAKFGSHLQAAQGSGGVYILGADPGPTASKYIDEWALAVGATRVVYEPFAYRALRVAAKNVFGVAHEPIFDLSGADLILDFGSDFLETWVSPVEHARQFSDARAVSGEGKRSRLVCFGPRLSLTVGNADEWVSVKPGTEPLVALAIANVALRNGASGSASVAGATSDRLLALVERFSPEAVAEKAGIAVDVIDRIGRALVKAQASVALPPGVALTSRRAEASVAAILILNLAIGAVGKTVKIPSRAVGARNRASYRDLLQLIDAMQNDRVKVLVIHDSNPAYSLRKAAGFAEALKKVPLVVSTASIQDETSSLASLILPDHTVLESWGDVESQPGVRSLIQPVIRPLKDTRALVDTLLDAARAAQITVSAGTFRSLLENEWTTSLGTNFREALARGGVFDAVATAPAALDPNFTSIDIDAPLLEGEGAFALLAYPSPLLSDGSGAALPWLQEIPDPVMKVAWQSWAEISNEKAKELGIEIGDLLVIETPVGKLEVPALPRGGLRSDVIAIALGQGHTVGEYASMGGGIARGVNVNDILPAAAADETGGQIWLSVRASVKPTGVSRKLPLVQYTDNQRGRMFGLAIDLPALEHGSEHHGEEGGHHLPNYDATNDALLTYPNGSPNPYRWGMTIDADRCTGCSACVAACYVENNVPIVGELQTLSARQMSWIRIERFVGDGNTDKVFGDAPAPNTEKEGDTDVRHYIALCQQCGAAPCEAVCPVMATVHDSEGLNAMVYNRCVGTRYCANNCPYKVRRFNWFDYSRDNWPGDMNLMLNPDVTVRGRGVMEKCSFCIQRIHEARQLAKDQGRPIADGEVMTACQQSCPTQAITIGNLRDKDSKAVKQADEAANRGYHALHELFTRPAVTYLKQVTRGKVGEEA